MQRFLFAAGAALCAAGCGDDSKACGMGTMDVSGYCLPTNTCGPGTQVDPDTNMCVPDGSVVCTGGTTFDPTTGTCVIDPTTCQDGTVLIGGACVDPTQGLVVDLDEGSTEPNGLNVIEASSSPAGTVTLKPIGDTFVIHGRLVPFEDADGDGQLDPDVDSYHIAVAAPTLLDISVDGVHGIDGGFVTLSQVSGSNPLAGWVRFGLSTTGDTSRRQVFLPSAGTYVLAIADTRTLYIYAGEGPADAAPGPGDYYVSISQLAVPAPTALTPIANVATHAGTTVGDAQFFTLPMGSGVNAITLAMPTFQASPSPVALDGDSLRGYAITNAGTAKLAVAGFAAGDNSLVVVDDLFNVATSPVPYTLTVRTRDAQQLGSGTASETETTNTFAIGGDLSTLDQFYFDVTDASPLVGMNVSWNHPVIGSLYDSHLHLAARFTALGLTTTWASYAGLAQLVGPGRYYFLVYDPSGTAGTTQLSATNHVAQLAPPAIAEGAAGTGSVALDSTYLANAFTYDAGADPWQTFDATGATTGGQQVRWFDRANAFGRIDLLASSAGTIAGDPAPIFTHSYGEAGGAIGRVLLDDPTTSYLVEVRATSPSAAPTFALTFDKRAITDFGTLVSGATMSDLGHILDAATTAGYFLFRTTTGNTATVTVHPHDATALDTELQRVARDESAIAPIIDNPTGDDSETFTQAGNGWTAVIVRAATPPASSQMYDFSVTIAP